MKLNRTLVVMAVVLLPSLARAQFFGSAMKTQNPCATYQGMLKSVGFSHHWKLNEKTGTVAADSIGTNSGTYVNAPAMNSTGPFNSSSGSRTLNGTNNEIQTSLFLSNPLSITILVWFKTSVGGGKLIGLGNAQSGVSNNFDRHIYMDASGKVSFGVWNNGDIVITSAGSYADNRWHMAVGSVGAAGMQLVIDGRLVGTNANTAPGCCNGYWRIGTDNLNGWPGSTSNYFFTGVISEAAAADSRQISLTQIQQLYAISKSCRVNSGGIVIQVTSATYGSGAQTCDATASVSSTCAGVSSCAVNSDNLICGDPASGVGKQLIVNYKCNGTSKSVTAAETAMAGMDCP